MSITFHCPKCQKSLQVQDDLAGKKVRCVGCQDIAQVPAASAAPAAKPAAGPPAKQATMGPPSKQTAPVMNNSTAPPARPPAGAPPTPAAAKPAAASSGAAVPAPPKPATPSAAAKAASPPTAPAKPNAAAPPAPAAAKPPPANAAATPAKLSDGVAHAPPPAKPAANAAPVVKPAAPPPTAPPKPAAHAAPVAKPVAPPPTAPPKPAASAAPVAKPVAPPPTGPAKPAVKPAAAAAAVAPSGVKSKTPVAAPANAKAAAPAKAGASVDADDLAAQIFGDAAEASAAVATDLDKRARPPVNAEDLAAEVLGDEPLPPPPPEAKFPEAAAIVFRCFYCDEEITVANEQGGKQVPCVHCRKIVKVPMPVKVEAKDWRKVETKRGPSGAKQDSAEPEGAWGSGGATSTVSQDSLAEALPEPREPLTVGQWVRRGSAAALVVAVLLGSGWAWWRSASKSTQQKALDAALQLVSKEGSLVGDESAAAVYRAAGDFYLRSNMPEEARTSYQNSRARLDGVRQESIERDLLLLDLGLSQIDLGGGKEQVLDNVRFKWEVAHKEYVQTLQKLTAPEARAEAARLVARKLLARAAKFPGDGLDTRAVAVAQFMSSGDAELLAIVGLEMLGANRTQAAKLADDALKAAKTARPAGADDKKPAIAPSLVALLVALDQMDKAMALAPPPRANTKILPEARVGYALGLAYQDKWKEAHGLAGAPGEPLPRLQALVAVATVAVDKSPGEAREIIQSIATLLEKEPLAGASPWLLLRAIRVVARTDPERVLKLVERFPASLRPRAEFEALRVELGARDRADPERLKAEAAKQAQAYPFTLELLGRHNAYYGDGAAILKAIASWDPESLRPLGQVGVALGMHEALFGKQH